MKDDRVAPIILRGDESLTRPGLASVARGIHSANAFLLGADPTKADPADADVLGIAGIYRYHADAARNAGLLRRSKKLPRFAAVGRAVDADSRIGIRREIRFPVPQ